MPYNDLRTGRVSLPGQIYHVTTVTAGREPLLQDEGLAKIVVEALHAAHEKELQSLTWVIMPDHLHWLLQLNDIPLSTVMKRFKGRTARAINKAAGRTGPVWQKAYHDHALRRDEDVKQVARYIVANPLRAGLVDQIEDYPWWWAVWMESS